jgi:nucleoside-diphosphate-sugar epimerase
MGELLLESYEVQLGYKNWSIIRPANIFGEYDDFSGKGTVIASTIKKVYEATTEIERIENDIQSKYELPPSFFVG